MAPPCAACLLTMLESSLRLRVGHAWLRNEQLLLSLGKHSPLLDLIHVCLSRVHLSVVVLHFDIAHEYVDILLPSAFETGPIFAA